MAACRNNSVSFDNVLKREEARQKRTGVKNTNLSDRLLLHTLLESSNEKQPKRIALQSLPSYKEKCAVPVASIRYLCPTTVEEVRQNPEPSCCPFHLVICVRHTSQNG